MRDQSTKSQQQSLTTWGAEISPRALQIRVRMVHGGSKYDVLIGC